MELTSSLPSRRCLGGVVLGAASAVGYAFATGIAFHAHGRDWEMGAIPLLLAAFFFVGLFAGMIAGLLCEDRPYLAALLATLLLVVCASTIGSYHEALTPHMTKDARREFWANIDGLLFAGFPLDVPFALWGALLVDREPLRLRGFRDASYGLAGFLAFVAVIPAAVHFLPWRIGLVVAAVMGVGLVVSLTRRGRTRARS